MNRFVFAALAFCALALCAPRAFAQQTQEPYAAATPTPAPNEFTDPAMTFFAPAGYMKALIPPHDPTDFEQPTVVAAFAGRTTRLLITIQMESFNGTLNGFEMVSENELRNQADGVFVQKKQQTTLKNGMPAYWQDITVGSGFDEAKRYQYVWIDGVRGVTLSITGHYGQITEQQAKDALADVSAVAYPQREP